MNAPDETRQFYRSEAFAEDVADFVEPALQPSVQPAPVARRQRTAAILWSLGLLPLAALAVGATWAI